MSLIRASALFKVRSSPNTYDKCVSLRPLENIRAGSDSSTTEYRCQICEQLADKYEFIGNFSRISFPEGTKQCPCCGINIDWNYKAVIE